MEENNRKKFSEEDINFIKENYNKMKIEDIAFILKRTKNSIYNMMGYIGVSNRYQWTENRINILKEFYPCGDWDILLKKLETNNKQNIMQKAHSLNLNFGHRWLSNEIKYLIKNFGKKSYEDIAKELNKTLNSIIFKAYKLKLVKNDRWSKNEIDLLIKLYPFYSNKKLSKEFFQNRKSTSINTMARKFNLKKDIEKNNKTYNEEDMLLQLKELSIKLGRTPLYNDLVPNGLASEKTYERRFGGYRNACKLAGLEINSNFFGDSITCYSKNKDFCFSKSEKIITDFFIDNNISYKKEQKYKDNIEDKRCGNKIVDWIIGNNIFVEFFGLPEKEYYFERMQEKRSICRDCNIVLLELYKKDLNKLNIKFKNYIN
jgi:hypothetical protein